MMAQTGHGMPIAKNSWIGQLWCGLK